MKEKKRPEIGSEAWMREQLARGLNPTQEMDRIPRPGDTRPPRDRRY